MFLPGLTPEQSEIAAALGVSPPEASRRYRVANIIDNLSQAALFGTGIGSIIDYMPDDELDFRLVYFASAAVSGLGMFIANRLGSKPAEQALQALESAQIHDSL